MLTSGIRLGSSHFLGGSNRGSGLMRVVSPANLGRAQSGVVCPCVHKNVQMPSQGVSGLVLKVTRSAQMIPHMRQSQFPRLSLALVSNSVLDSQIPWLFLFRHCLRASGIPKPTAYISPRCEDLGRLLESNAVSGSGRGQCSTLESGSNGRTRWVASGLRSRGRVRMWSSVPAGTCARDS